MASTHEELFTAIEAGDVAAVRAIVEADPAAATSRDGAGVSALMRARTGFDRELVDAVRDRVDELDVFEAAAFGDLDRLAQHPGRRPRRGHRLRGRRLHGAALRRVLRAAGGRCRCCCATAPRWTPSAEGG